MAELLLGADPISPCATATAGSRSFRPASVATRTRWSESKTGFDLDHFNDLGWTALLEAVILGEGSDRWQRVVRSLLENGADPSIADRNGMTPLEHARSRGFTEVADILERHSIERFGE